MYRISDDVLIQEMDEYAMVYLTRDGIIHVVNSVAAYILQLILEGKQTESIVSAVEEKYISNVGSVQDDIN